MDTSLQFRPEDRLQKTWIPEGTHEYKVFKHTTLENNFLLNLLKEKITLLEEDVILDVGGREGDIGLGLCPPERFHLVDPDPTLKLSFTPGKFWNERIQDIELVDSYKLIICCHVLGYLGTQNVQNEVFFKLLNHISVDGTLALFYNSNENYSGELLNFSKTILSEGHYDYFDESLLKELNSDSYSIEFVDTSFELSYSTYEDLARCCWFLFGARDNDIDAVSKLFLPKLMEDLPEPKFTLDEKVVLIKRLA